MKSKVRPAVFLSAAVWLDELRATCSHGCCAALGLAGSTDAEYEFYITFFGKGSYLSQRVQWGDAANHSPAQHEARIWALLICWAEACDTTTAREEIRE